MKVMKTGRIYKICDDSMVVMDTLPAKTYRVAFGELTGFYLEEVPDFTVTERLYGNRAGNIDMVLDTYKAFAEELHRSLGVILSGSKGIGKTMFAKMVCIKAKSNGYPVILVPRSYDGIAGFISDIKQQAVVLFDEFDKTFGSEGGSGSRQTELLTLFDGTTSDTKLFIITCNSVWKISDYVVNRPGRFHYHFRFDCLSAEEIREYMLEELSSVYRDQDGNLTAAGEQAISDVVKFGVRISLNYDCMRSIVFEINRGVPFNTAIDYLNIVNTDSETYDVELRLDDGTILHATDEIVDLFDTGVISVGMYSDGDTDCRTCDISFRSHDVKLDRSNINVLTVDPGKIKIKWRKHDMESKAVHPVSVTMRRHAGELFRYRLAAI